MSEERYDIMKEFASLVAAISKPPFLAADLNDTTLVLIATSLVDEFLKVVLIAGFHEDVVSKRRLDDVFTGYGALAPFSAKISLCALLGLTTSNVRHDLTILRKIRNDFAHSREQLYLTAFPGCLALKVTTKFEIADKLEERLRLKQSCMGIIGQLSLATMVRIAQYRFISKNRDGVEREREAMIAEAFAIDDAPPE
jgi:hypothetical protein